jgi:hypothetical protein
MFVTAIEFKIYVRNLSVKILAWEKVEPQYGAVRKDELRCARFASFEPRNAAA